MYVVLQCSLMIIWLQIYCWISHWKNFWKSVKTWWSYRCEFCGFLFWNTVEKGC